MARDWIHGGDARTRAEQTADDAVTFAAEGDYEGCRVSLHNLKQDLAEEVLRRIHQMEPPR